MNFIQKKAREWALKVVHLDKLDVNPKLQPKKNKLLKSAFKIKNSIEKVTGNLDALDALDRISKNYELGLIPQVAAVLGVAAAASVIAKWTYDYNTIVKENNEIKRLESKGMTSQQAYALVRKKPLNISTKMILGVLFLGGAYFYFNKKGN